MSKPRINPWSIYLIIAMMLVVYYNYLQELNRQKDSDRPAYYSALKTNLTATEQSGKEVSLDQLRGKVYLCNYVFTRCPGQCIGVGEVMKERLADYKGHPLFHMVSVTLDPSNDTPEDLREFTKNNDLQSDQWWFLTGEEKKIRSYMSNYFKFAVADKPVADRTTDRDLFLHDPLIAIVDHKARIRGVYEVYGEKGEEFQERLKADLDKVMEEAMADTPMTSVPKKDGFAKDVPLEGDIELERQDGAAVKISDLQGKVTIVSHVFTRCPRQCPGICAAVNEIREEFAGSPALMVASLTMDPAYDTPEILAKFAKTFGYEADNWWFLTGDEKELPEFMEKQFQFAQQDMPQAQRQVPSDLYEHDSNVALLDHNLRIRGWYSAVDEAAMERLRMDIKMALAAVPSQ